MRAKPTIGRFKLPVKETTEFQGKLVAMNEELMLRSMRQHELAEVAVASNTRLQKEIAGRKQMEAALRESEKRYRTLFDLVPVAIYSCDAAGLIQKFNRCAAKLWSRRPKLGEDGERFCGSFNLFRPDGAALPLQHSPMADVLSGKISAVHNAEVIIERPDRTRIVVVADIRPLLNKEGKIIGAINCFYDITERKQAEEAQSRLAVLAATNQKLELEIAQRRAAEQSLVTSQHEQGRLLEEAQDMHHQLRLLSRQLLSVQEEERKRISRELHDVIAQTLAAINLQLAALKRDAGMDPDERAQNITRAQTMVEQSMDVVHRFARELRPTLLDDVGLIPALHTFLKGFKKETGLQVSLSVFAGIEQVNADKRIILYRIAQEALTNVGRHARASRVDVSIQKQDGAICMEIKDNGKGLPVENFGDGKKSKRLGLLGMKERLEMIGGKFAIESVPGHGATVTARIPFKVHAGFESMGRKASS